MGKLIYYYAFSFTINKIKILCNNIMVYKSLTEYQKKKLKIHSIHHTKKHIDMMKREMRNGKTFKEAHIKTEKLIGK